MMKSSRESAHPSTMVPPHLFQTDRHAPSPRVVERWRQWGIESHTFQDDCAGHAWLQRTWGQRAASAFRSLRAGGIRSDLLRLCYLASNGGWYSDTDNHPSNVSMRQLGGAHRLVVVASIDADREASSWRPRVFNAFMGAEPRHAALLRLCERAIERVVARHAEDSRASAGRDYRDVLGIAGPTLLRPLLDEPRALVLREWPRGRVYHDALKDEVLSHDGGNYRKGKPWWIHWRHLANRKSVYHPRNLTPSLVGTDGSPCK